MRASKINAAAGWRLLLGVVGTREVGARRDEDRLAAGPGQELRKNGLGCQWQSRAGAGGEGRQICRAQTYVSSVPTSHPSHQSLHSPSTVGT